MDTNTRIDLLASAIEILLHVDKEKARMYAESEYIQWDLWNHYN